MCDGTTIWRNPSSISGSGEPLTFEPLAAASIKASVTTRWHSGSGLFWLFCAPPSASQAMLPCFKMLWNLPFARAWAAAECRGGSSSPSRHRVAFCFTDLYHLYFGFRSGSLLELCLQCSPYRPAVFHLGFCQGDSPLPLRCAPAEIGISLLLKPLLRLKSATWIHNDPQSAWRSWSMWWNDETWWNQIDNRRQARIRYQQITAQTNYRVKTVLQAVMAAPKVTWYGVSTKLGWIS